MMGNGIDADKLYMQYNVMKMHFSSSYDVRKYGFNNKRFSYAAFERDRFKSVYYALAKKFDTYEDAQATIAANLVRDSTTIPNNLNQELGILLRKYNKNKVSLVEDLTQSISSGLLTSIKNGDIIDSIAEGSIPIEHISFLNRLIGIVDLMDAFIPKGFMWDMVKTKIIKYDVFCRFDSVDQLNVIKRHVLDVIKQQQT